MSIEKFRDGPIGPTVILLTICAVITISLAAVYQATNPIIKQGEIDTANKTRGRVFDLAESFSEVTGVSLPDGVSEIYKADNGTGYVIRASANGYGGAVTFMIGIDADGNITGIELFDHNETPGLGTKAGNESYLSKYLGDVDPDSVDAITGATKTSNALKNSIKEAKEAFKIVSSR